MQMNRPGPRINSAGRGKLFLGKNEQSFRRYDDNNESLPGFVKGIAGTMRKGRWGSETSLRMQKNQRKLSADP